MSPISQRVRSKGQLLLFIFLVTIAASAMALQLPPVIGNLREIASRIGIHRYQASPFHKAVKIAILDNGFRGAQTEIGKSLPQETIIHAGPVAVDVQQEDEHGRVMAQIIAALLSQTPGLRYELHLYSAYGYSNFSAAVSSVIVEHFDVVLYSQVWEYGGNNDGRGFINAQVDRATKAGVLWINAAGNFATSTYRSALVPSSDDWVKLPGPNDSVQIRCAKSDTGNTCPLRAVLSWNDFKDDVKVGTDKDLDLVLTDDTLRIVASSALIQMKHIPDPAPPGASLYPREIVETLLQPGLYNLRAKIRSHNFNSRTDKIAITVSGPGIDLLNRTRGESILPPADNSSVITVGADDTEISSTSTVLRKPELVTLSRLQLVEGGGSPSAAFIGSSNSAAYVAALASVLVGLNPGLDRAHLLRLLKSSMVASGGQTFPPGLPPQPLPPQVDQETGRGLPVETLDFLPTGHSGAVDGGQRCFIPTRLPFYPSALTGILAHGGRAVETTRGIKIFTPYDPFAAVGVIAVSPDDMLVVDANGFEPLPRSNQPYLIPGSYEVVQIPAGEIICPATQPTSTSRWD